MKKKIQSVLKHSLYNFRFQNTTRIRQSTHCIANDMKTTWMITLKNFTRCPEYFQMEKLCKFFILNIRKKCNFFRVQIDWIGNKEIYLFYALIGSNNLSLRYTQ